MEKNFWGIEAFCASCFIWYRRAVIIRGIVSVVLAVLRLLKRRSIVEISALKSLIFVGASIGNIAGETMVNNKIGVEDLPLLGKLIPVFPALLAIDFKSVIPEVKDLSEAEAVELVDYYKQVFNIPQESLEVKIETILSLCVRLYGIIAELVLLFKKNAVA